MRLIDADAALKALRKCQTYLYDARDQELKIKLSSAKAAINNLPTIQPEKAQLSKEDTTSDLISRQAVIDAIVQCTNCGDEDTLREYVLKHNLDNGWTGGILEALDAVKDLPPAQPEPTDINAKEAVYNLAEKIGIHQLFALTVELRGEPIQPEPQWISVTERLPDNADHPGAFCPRYQVVTPYGVTEGWYRPHDHEKGGQWFALFWFMSQIYEIWNIDFERGDVPKVIGEAPVMEWRPLPEPYKPNK